MYGVLNKESFTFILHYIRSLRLRTTGVRSHTIEITKQLDKSLTVLIKLLKRSRGVFDFRCYYEESPRTKPVRVSVGLFCYPNLLERNTKSDWYDWIIWGILRSTKKIKKISYETLYLTKYLLFLLSTKKKKILCQKFQSKTLNKTKSFREESIEKRTKKDFLIGECQIVCMGYLE